jgi:predicted dehydrogenase
MALNLAIISAGFIPHHAIARIVKRNGSQLYSIHGRNPNLGKQFHSQYGFPTLSMDLADLLSDPNVDVGYICLPRLRTH